MVRPENEKAPRGWVRGFVARNQSCEFVAVVCQALESSDSPMLNAFCRVAPSDRFNFLAILAAGVFFRASDLSSRTCTDVHERLFVPFFINESPWIGADVVAENV
jgi:hypothetical protein